MALVALALAGLVGFHATGEPVAPDLRLIAQSMSFLLNPPTGSQQIGIVYPAGSATGEAEAEDIQAAFGSGLQLGSLTLHPRLLTIEQAAHDHQVIALLLTDAALPQANLLATAVAGRGMLTVTWDPVAVSEGKVVLAVRSQPNVEIFVSRAAAQAAGVEFSTAFRMMIQER